MNPVHPYRRVALILLGGFFLWGAVSYYWYACGIKNLCSTQQVTITQATHEVAKIPDDIHVTQVLVYEKNECAPYLTGSVGVATRNNPADVSLVEQFLSVYQNENIVIDGVYTSDDIAGIRRFQNAQGISATGNVFNKTREAINALVCAE
ncbi:MAG: peptidoglycan-binding domain-containing protein [Minisyncoccia bacterium]